MSELYSPYPAELSAGRIAEVKEQLHSSIIWNKGKPWFDGRFFIKENRGVPDLQGAVVEMWSAKLMGGIKSNRMLYVHQGGFLEIQRRATKDFEGVIRAASMRFVSASGSGDAFIVSTGHVVIDQLYSIGGTQVNAQEVVRMLEASERGDNIGLHSDTPFFKLHPDQRSRDRIRQIGFRPKNGTELADAVLIAGKELLPRRMTRPFLG